MILTFFFPLNSNFLNNFLQTKSLIDLSSFILGCFENLNNYIRSNLFYMDIVNLDNYIIIVIFTSISILGSYILFSNKQKLDTIAKVVSIIGGTLVGAKAGVDLSKDLVGTKTNDKTGNSSGKTQPQPSNASEGSKAQPSK